MISVLYLFNAADPIGGGEVSLLKLLEALDRREFRPLVVVPAEGSIARRCRDLRIPVHAVDLPSPKRLRILSMLRSVRTLTRLLRAEQVHLVHANGSRAMIYGGLAARLTAVPCLWHVRVAERDPLLDPFLRSLAQAIVVNSEAVRNRFPQSAQPKTRVIYNGVDLEEFHPRPPSPQITHELRLTPEEPVVGIVGRLVPFKGHRTFLDAAALLRKKQPETRYLIVGDGPLRASLEEYARSLHLTDRCLFTGHRDDIPDLLSTMDVFVLSSLFEHFGRVVIEALAMKLPVVATEAGGIPEIIRSGENGLLVTPEDPRALADAVLTLLENPALRERLTQAGYRTVTERFPLVRHAREMEKCYRALVGRTG